jgi:hypothetical protein
MNGYSPLTGLSPDILQFLRYSSALPLIDQTRVPPNPIEQTTPPPRTQPGMGRRALRNVGTFLRGAVSSGEGFDIGGGIKAIKQRNRDKKIAQLILQDPTLFEEKEDIEFAQFMLDQGVGLPMISGLLRQQHQLPQRRLRQESTRLQLEQASKARQQLSEEEALREKLSRTEPKAGFGTMPMTAMGPRVSPTEFVPTATMQNLTPRELQLLGGGEAAVKMFPPAERAGALEEKLGIIGKRELKQQELMLREMALRVNRMKAYMDVGIMLDERGEPVLNPNGTYAVTPEQEFKFQKLSQQSLKDLGIQLNPLTGKYELTDIAKYRSAMTGIARDRLNILEMGNYVIMPDETGQLHQLKKGDPRVKLLMNMKTQLPATTEAEEVTEFEMGPEGKPRIKRTTLRKPTRTTGEEATTQGIITPVQQPMTMSQFRTKVQTENPGIRVDLLSDQQLLEWAKTLKPPVNIVR